MRPHYQPVVPKDAQSGDRCPAHVRRAATDEIACSRHRLDRSRQVAADRGGLRQFAAVRSNFRLYPANLWVCGAFRRNPAMFGVGAAMSRPRDADRTVRDSEPKPRVSAPQLGGTQCSRFSAILSREGVVVRVRPSIHCRPQVGAVCAQFAARAVRYRRARRGTVRSYDAARCRRPPRRFYRGVEQRRKPSGLGSPTARGRRRRS